MNTRHLISCAGAVLSAAVMVGAQGTQAGAQSAQTPGTDKKATKKTASRAGQSGGAVTMVGCLVHEGDVPGLQPTMTERVGIGEDFVLAQATPKGTSTKAAAGHGNTTQDRNELASSIYKIQGLDKDRLEPLLGKRVEVSGTLAARNASEPTAGQRTGTTTDVGASAGSGTSSERAGGAGSGTSIGPSPRSGAGGTAGGSAEQQSAEAGSDKDPRILQARSIRAVQGPACQAHGGGR